MDDRLTFVIKLWREDEQPDLSPEWRGQITHLPSGRRTHFTQLDQIEPFIQPYLGQPAVQSPPPRGFFKRVIYDILRKFA